MCPARASPTGTCVRHTRRLCGGEGNRTPGLFDATEALYQLSYTPDWKSGRIYLRGLTADPSPPCALSDAALLVRRPAQPYWFADRHSPTGSPTGAALLVRRPANHGHRGRFGAGVGQVVDLRGRRGATAPQRADAVRRRQHHCDDAGAERPRRVRGQDTRKCYANAQRQQRADVSPANRCLLRTRRHRCRRPRPALLALRARCIRQTRNARRSGCGSTERIELLAEVINRRPGLLPWTEQARHIGCEHDDPRNSQEHQDQLCHASPALSAGLPTKGAIPPRAHRAFPLRAHRRRLVFRHCRRLSRDRSLN